MTQFGVPRGFLLSLLAVATLFSGCRTEKTAATRLAETAPPTTAVERIPGEVQVLNGCGEAGVAELIRQHLVQRGFDVVETGNSKDWNYEKTLIAVRTPGWEGAARLARALKTDRVVVLLNSRVHADATVFVGTDFQEILNDDTFRR